jgi:hypothetical protein
MLECEGSKEGQARFSMKSRSRGGDPTDSKAVQGDKAETHSS